MTHYSFSLLATIIFLIMGCGTQTGNPPSIDESQLQENPILVSQFINSSYSDVIDAITSGDTSYRKDELRVTNSKKCGEEFSLITNTEAKHSVYDSNSIWNATSALEIKRQNSQILSINENQINCKNEFPNSSVNEQLKFISNLDEAFSRSVIAKILASGEIIADSLTHRKIGLRETLLTTSETSVEGKITENTTHTIESDHSALGFKFEAKFDALRFEVQKNLIERNDSYTIKAQELNFIGPKREILTMRFENVELKPGSCIPNKGLLAIELSYEGKTYQSDLDFSLNYDGFLNFGTDMKIPFIPTGCTLNEK